MQTKLGEAPAVVLMFWPNRVPVVHDEGVMTTPLKVIDTFDTPAKPAPVIVTEFAEDRIPEVGLRVIVHAVTVDEVVATWPAAASVATAVLVPAVTPLVNVGMTNWQTKAPAAVVVIVVPVNVQVALVLPLGVIATPSKVSVTLVEAAKPAPRAVAVDPMRPLGGPTDKVHAVTVVDDDATCAG